MIYRFERYELDTELYELRADGVPCHVEPQVFNLLRYLIEHADHVVTKDELLENLWPGRVVSESALTSRLKSARRLIGDSGSEQRLIRTIHGRGYRFVGTVDPAGIAPPAGAADAAPCPIGRGAALTRLLECWRNAGEGRLEIVFVEGEAGIGKTTLVEALLAEVRSADGAAIGVGQCADVGEAGEAYLPVLDALGGLLASPGGGDVRAVLEAVAPTWLLQLPGPLSVEERDRLERRIIGVTQERMLREFAAALRELGRDRPVLLVLEDLHWADPSTLALIAWLGRRREPERAMIVASHRPPTAAGAAQGLAEAVDSLCLRRLAVRIALEPLDRDGIAEFLARRFEGRAVDAAIVDALHARTEGNPLFLASVVESLVDRGVLSTTASRVAPENPALDPLGEIPDSLRRVIAHEIERVDAADRGLLEAASVADSRVASALIAAMLGGDCDDCEARLAALAAKTSLIVREGDTTWPDGTTSTLFRFRHALYREAIHATLPAGQRARLHGLAGARLEAAYGAQASERAVELAAHFTTAGNAAKALRYRLQAAQQAYGRGGYREVIAHLDEGLALLDRHTDVPDRDEIELSLNLSIAPALIQINGWSDPRAEQALVRAIGIAERSGDRRLASGIYLLAAVHELRGEYSESQRLLEQQQQLPDAFEHALAELESHELMACSLFHQGAFGEALEHARAGLAVGRDYDVHSKLYAYGENPRVSCHNWAGLSQWFLGYPEQARSAIDAALELARRPDRRFSLSNALCQAATLAQLRREPEAALGFAGEAIEVAGHEGFRYPLAVARIISGWALAVTGKPHDGIPLIEEGLEGHRQSGAAMDRPYFLGLLAEALLEHGDRDAARATLDEALATLERERRFFYEPELLRLRARLESMESTPAARERAIATLEASREAAVRSGNRIGRLRAEVDLVALRATAAERQETLEALGRTLDTFTEGLDSADLRAAMALVPRC